MANKVFNLKKRTYLYALEIIKFLNSLPNDYISQTMGKQLLRSATSIGANIVEAQSSCSKKGFTNFYSYSLKSANESKFWINLLKDSGKASIEKIGFLAQETDELSNILASCILTLKGKR